MWYHKILLTDFHENWYEYHAIRGYPMLEFLIHYYVYIISIRRACELLSIPHPEIVCVVFEKVWKLY